MKKIAILIMIITIISKVLGLVRDITLSYFYGASNISDAYLISITIPMVIFSIIGVGISIGYIPIYTKIEGINGVDKGNRFTSNLMNLLMIVYTIIIILGIIFANQIVRLFASGFEEETFKMAVLFTKIALVGIYATGAMKIYREFLQLKGNYYIPAFVVYPLIF